MRRLVGGIAFACLVGLGGACGSSDPEPYVLAFGPYTIAPSQEVTDQCVQITLHNDDYVYINAVELTTGPGFHHSNWFYVPERTFEGEDGTFTCDDRDFNEPVAAIFGGVLFAQSTQAPHEIQQFPDGVAIKIPPHFKLVTQIHLLNATENTLELSPTIKLTPIPKASVDKTLAGISFQNQALALPPDKASRFTVECDLAPTHEMLFGTDPDFKIYYALAHYHELGTGLTVEAVKPDGTSATVYTTTTHVGDALGGPIEPAFDMTGYTKLRFWCDFYNPRAETVTWGVGDQEMCVFLAFSDSPYNWGGGVNEPEPPQNPVEVGSATYYTNGCTVFANDATR
ncbi:MAG TPA: hypothetical protein VFQ53_17165 [Kofleriaceae bacterium]|nr:hypothetical protein [Kofleriaceae bacterium]